MWLRLASNFRKTASALPASEMPKPKLADQTQKTLTIKIMTIKLSRTIAAKVLKTVDAGLVKGMGTPVAGNMCIEAAVSFALGLPHGDNPKCVGSAVRSFKIALNDCEWSSNAARADGMRKIAVAQLGSDAISQEAFCELLCVKGVQKVLPKLLRWLTEWYECKTKEQFQALAVECEAVKGLKAARVLARKVKKETWDASAYAYASASACASACASTYAYAYKSAYAYAYASASAYSYAYASASAYAKLKEKFGEDYFQRLLAEICLEALIELKSPGCKWLSLCDIKIKK